MVPGGENNFPHVTKIEKHSVGLLGTYELALNGSVNINPFQTLRFQAKYPPMTKTR